MNLQVNTQQPQGMAAQSAMPLSIVPVHIIRQRAEAVHQVMSQMMSEGQHYYALGAPRKIKLSNGTELENPNFALSKSGAELICMAFQLVPKVSSEVIERPDDVKRGKDRRKDWFNSPAGGRDFKWVEEEWECHGYYEALSTCEIFGPNGQLLASAQGTCSNMEAKYRTQNVHDIKNTILKMSQKRAYVAAVLLATAASDIFTQDEGDPENDGRNSGGTSSSSGSHSAKSATNGAVTNGLNEKQNGLAAVKARETLGLSGPDLEAFMSWLKELLPTGTKSAKAALDALCKGGTQAETVRAAFLKARSAAVPPIPPVVEPEVIF